MLINKDKIRNFLQNIYHPYRIVVYNEHLERKGTFKLTIVNLISFFAVLISIVIIMTYCLLAFTPIKVIIPGVNNQVSHATDSDFKLQQRVDSMEKEIYQRDLQLKSLRKTYGFDSSSSYLPKRSLFHFASYSTAEDQVGIDSKNESSDSDNILGKNIFVPPVRGYISDHFAPATEHYATDIVTNRNAPVKATMDGFVIYAEWSASTGNVIILQHEKNLLSVYKHNSVLLKKVGTFVRSGEAIALVGNSGELTTGPHLHFELWQNGSPLNAEEFVAF